MEVILQQDYPSLGYVGDQVKVRGGFARNFLIPRGIATEATSANARQLGHKMAIINARKSKLKQQAQEMVKKLEALALEFVLRVGEGGRSFGSISVKDVDAALNKELEKQGMRVDRRQIKLSEAIRKAGDYKVTVKLHSEVTAEVGLKVRTELSESAKPEAKKAKARRARTAAREKPGSEAALESSQESLASMEESADGGGSKARARKGRKAKGQEDEEAD